MRIIETKDGPLTKMRLNFGLTEVKFADGAAPGTFSGYGAVFSNEDLGGDVILPGAFGDTLAAWKAKGKLPKMLWQHGYDDNSLPVGIWTKMLEDDRGLAVEGRLIALDTDRGKVLHEGMQTGAIDAMSITYVATDVIYGSKEGEPWRTIRKLDLYEVGPVLFGMNEDATIDEAKAARSIKTIRDFESFLRDAGGFSIADAKAIASGGFKAKSALRDEGDVANALAGLRERAAGIFTNT
jgi:HK97 family phage prohead protease